MTHPVIVVALVERRHERLVDRLGEGLVGCAGHADRVERPGSAGAQLADEAEQSGVLAYLLAHYAEPLLGLADHLGELVLQSGIGCWERAHRSRRGGGNCRGDLRDHPQGRAYLGVERSGDRARDPEGHAERLRRAVLGGRARRRLQTEVAADRGQVGVLLEEQVVADGLEVGEESHHLLGEVGFAQQLIDDRFPLVRGEARAAGGRRAGLVARRIGRSRSAAVPDRGRREVALQLAQIHRRRVLGRPHVAYGGHRLRDFLVGLRDLGEFRERGLLRRRKRGVAVGQVALPAAGAATVVEPGADPVRAARDHVLAFVAVDVTGLDRRVVLRMRKPRVACQRQRRRGRQLLPGLLSRVIGPRLQALALGSRNNTSSPPIPSILAVRIDPHMASGTLEAAPASAVSVGSTFHDPPDGRAPTS